jgi:rhamnosyltransferase
MLRPKVLVLLAAYNGSRWIGEQIRSILNQSEVDVHLVVSDDGSTDDTLEQVRRWTGDSRITLDGPPTPTGSAAQNFLWLIRNTDAEAFEYIALADQDDVWLDQKLSRACRALDAQDAGGYSCAVTAFWSDGSEALLSQNSRLTASDFLFEGAGQGCTFVLTVRLFSRLKTFLADATLQTQRLHYHDWTIYALSRAWKVQWIFDSDPMVRYRQHNHNDTGARASVSGLIKRLSLIKSGWYRRQVEAVAEICFASAPREPVIANWYSILHRPRGILRRIKAAAFCLQGGRRRRSDRLMLLIAIASGWL